MVVASNSKWHQGAGNSASCRNICGFGKGASAVNSDCEHNSSKSNN